MTSPACSLLVDSGCPSVEAKGIARDADLLRYVNGWGSSTDGSSVLSGAGCSAIVDT